LLRGEIEQIVIEVKVCQFRWWGWRWWPFNDDRDNVRWCVVVPTLPFQSIAHFFHHPLRFLGSKDAYIVGTTSEGKWAGLKTVVVET
jgi:hypothetical protein